VQRCAGINVLVTHQTSQEPPALIAMIQSQVNLQHQLLESVAVIDRQDQTGVTMQQRAAYPCLYHSSQGLYCPMCRQSQ
jgi:hypothetical protein